VQDFESVFKGFVTDLARMYLDCLSADELAEVEVYACGPHPMLELRPPLYKANQKYRFMHLPT
jgi:dihydroorotate dehydrogenase electron transfer subunit